MAFARLPAGVSFPTLPNAQTDSFPEQPTHTAPPTLEVTQRLPVFIQPRSDRPSLSGSCLTALCTRRHDELVSFVSISDVFADTAEEVKHTILAVCELRIMTYHLYYSFRCASE